MRPSKKPRVGSSPLPHKNLYHQNWNRMMFETQLSLLPSRQHFDTVELQNRWKEREEEVRNFEKEQSRKQRKNWKNSERLFNSSAFTQNSWNKMPKSSQEEKKKEKMKIRSELKKRKLDENSENGENGRENTCNNSTTTSNNNNNKNVRKFKKAKRKIFLFPENDYMEVDY